MTVGRVRQGSGAILATPEKGLATGPHWPPARVHALSEAPSPPYAEHMDEREALSIGDRIRILRQRRGLTQVTLAALCGRGEDWIKRIESGRRGTTLSQLARIAHALGVTDLSDLTGTDIGMPVVHGGAVHDAVAPIRAAVRGATLAPMPKQAESTEILAHRARSAWQLWHRSKYGRSEVGALLPDLISDVHAAARLADGADRRSVYEIMTDIYALTQQVLAYVSEPELYWAVADRIQMSAQQADRPHALGLAAWCMANGLRHTAEPHDAITTAAAGIAIVQSHLDGAPDDMRGLCGALHLHAAVSYAQQGREGDAWREWDAADDIAHRLGQGYLHLPTVFGVDNTAVHGVAIATEVSKAGTALEKASTIAAESLPSTERASRLLIDAARAHHQRKDTLGALHELNHALDVSPENTRAIPTARSLALDLSRTRMPSQAAQIDATLERMGLAASE
jgi:transcriptional regulator with XRE-family HTH domain